MGDRPADLPSKVLQGFIDDIETGQVTVPIGHVYRLDEIVEAHQAMEDGTMSGKLVVTTGR
jgi:NADPH:quinone reductase-like Zn-dependent oxidoreductase